MEYDLMCKFGCSLSRHLVSLGLGLDPRSGEEVFGIWMHCQGCCQTREFRLEEVVAFRGLEAKTEEAEPTTTSTSAGT